MDYKIYGLRQVGMHVNKNELQYENLKDGFHHNILDSILILKSSVQCMQTVLLNARNHSNGNLNELVHILDDEMELIKMEYSKLELLAGDLNSNNRL